MASSWVESRAVSACLFLNLRGLAGNRGRKTGNFFFNNLVMFWVFNSEVGWDHACAYHCYFSKTYLNVTHIISNISCLAKNCLWYARKQKKKSPI